MFFLRKTLNFNHIGKISLVVYWLFGHLMLANPLYFLSFTGGSSLTEDKSFRIITKDIYDTFQLFSPNATEVYLGTKAFHKNRFGIRSCYNTFAENIVIDGIPFDDFKEMVVKNENWCSADRVKTFLNYTIGHSGNKMDRHCDFITLGNHALMHQQSLEQIGLPIDGASTPQAFEQSLKRLIKTLPSGSELFLSLVDHGTVVPRGPAEDSNAITKNIWAVLLNGDQPELSPAPFPFHQSDEITEKINTLIQNYYQTHFYSMNDAVETSMQSSFVTTSSLKKYFGQLKARGVRTHLAVTACYSGGFVKELRGLGCVTGTSSKDYPTYGSSPETDPLYHTTYDIHFGKALKEYHNQLSAFACSFAQDTVNSPTTTLDEWVTGWYASNSDHPDHKESKDLKDSQEIRSVRAQLLSAFAVYVEKPFTQCQVDKKSFNIDHLFNVSMVKCIDNEKERLQEFLQNNEMLQEMMGSIKHYSQRKRNDIFAMAEAHKHFIKNAPTYLLKKYKEDFCCLAYDFNLKKSPSFCDAIN